MLFMRYSIKKIYTCGTAPAHHPVETVLEVQLRRFRLEWLQFDCHMLIVVQILA